MINFKGLSLVIAVFIVAGIDAAAFSKESLRERTLTFDYGGVKVRGVNLGGWLVLEPWITPSIFDSVPGAIDEYTLCSNLGLAACQSKLSAHWDTFITESDFYQIAAAGMNHVRIPIGHWGVKPYAPYAFGQLEYLNRAIIWARAAGLKVWIDLHGAPGSQNGFDNSGWRDRLEWQNGNNVQLTVEVIWELANRYARSGDNDVVTAIELLNEPMGPRLDMARIKQFWKDGWGTVREVSDIAVVIGDAFYDPGYWNGFMTNGFSHVILDTHHYEVFNDGQLSLSAQDHINSVCGFGRMLRGLDKWTVTGEWSAARTDCTKYLNGIGRGTRWEGKFEGSSYHGNCENRLSGSTSAYSAQERSDSKAYIEAQLDAYEQGAGWFFWTWKTEGAPDWDMKDLLANGLFPQPLTSGRVNNRCGF